MALVHTKTLTLLVAATALSAVGAETDVAAALFSRTVGFVGEFCHTGTVTMVCGNRNFALEERDGRRHFLFVEENFGVRRCDVVAVDGQLAIHDDGTVFKVARKVRRLGSAQLPPPTAVSLADLINRDYAYRRVTTEGTLVLTRTDEIDVSVVQLLLKDGGVVLNAAYTPKTNATDNVPSLLGARLRLTGVLMHSSGGARMNVASYLSFDVSDGLEVVHPPPADIFDVPELDFETSWTPSELVRMDTRRFEGVVAATWGADQMMVFGRDFHRARATLSRPEELPSAGDRVVVAGFPDTDLYGISLIYARCKPLPGSDVFTSDPKPADATLRQLLTDSHGRPRINGYSNGRLLRLKGTVLDVQPSLALFSLNDDGLTMPVDYSSSPDVASLLEPNSKVEAVVLAVVETDSWRESIVLPQTRGIKLVLRSAQDLKVLAHPPWWTPARLTATVIFLVALIVFIIVANRIINQIVMRRKVAERTRLAVELHDSLSQTLAGVACQIATGHDAVDEDPGAAKALLATAERMLEPSRTELKNCLFDLRSDTVDDPDFERAISKTLTELKSEADISIRFRVARSLMTDTTAHAVLCIIRELAANAVSHGAARRIWVAGTENAGLLQFSVRDNGRGFDPKRRPGPREGHFGLAGIRERLAELGGEMSIESEACRGTKVSVKLKIK